MVRGLTLRALCAYVPKTGVMGILKLFHLDTEAFERCQFVDILYDMIRAPDASVVNNCILVLNEIMSWGDRPIILHLLNLLEDQIVSYYVAHFLLHFLLEKINLDQCFT